jgi:hypothetical protein
VAFSREAYRTHQSLNNPYTLNLIRRAVPETEAQPAIFPSRSSVKTLVILEKESWEFGLIRREAQHILMPSR